MQYTFLGKTGVQVSRLCFGTMSFGGDADEAISAQLFKRTRDAGINFTTRLMCTQKAEPKKFWAS